MEEEGKRRGRVIFLSILLLTIISTIAYGNSLHNSFQFDDQHVILDNPDIRDIAEIKTILSHNYSRPLLYLSFALNYHFGQLDPLVYRLTNLLLHIGNSILLFLILLVTLTGTGNRDQRLPVPGGQVALFASLLFAAHPVHTEAITYLSSRSSVLCTFFYLLSLLFFIMASFRQRGIEGGRERVKAFAHYLGSLIAFLCALGSKELAVTLPLVLLLYDGLFISGGRGLFLRIRRYHLPFLLILALLFPLRYYLYGSPDSPVYVRSIYANLLTQFRVILNYLRLLFFPLNLNAYPDFPIAKSLLEPPVFFSTLILVGVTTSGLIMLRYARSISYGIFWFFLTLAPSSSIVPLYDVMAEHRLYLPAVGFSIAVGMVLGRLLAEGDRFPAAAKKAMRPVSLVFILIIFSLQTVSRNLVWESPFSLWLDTVKKSPGLAKAHYNMGTAYQEAGLINEAIFEYTQAIKIKPDYENAYSNLGNIYERLGKSDLAIQYYRKAIDSDPDLAEAHSNLGLALAKQHEYALAEASLKKAISIKPDLRDAHFNLAVLYEEQGMLKEAIPEYREVIRIEPGHAQAHYNLARIYRNQGMIDEAISEYRNMISIDPDNAQAHTYLGIAYGLKGLIEQGISEHKKAIAIDPGYAGAHNNLAVAYYSAGRYELAWKHLRNAEKLGYRVSPGFIHDLQQVSREPGE